MNQDSETLQLKIDLHVHSYYSSDSLITPAELLHYAKERHLNGVAVTDHDRLEGALTISRETDFLVIPGIEVSSLDGHIIGLNVHKNIPKDLTADETVRRIHEAGGIAIACHPSGFFKGSLGNKASSKFDAIEVMNSSTFPFGYSTKRSEKIAKLIGIPRVAGSDAHYGPEIGYAYTLIEAEPNVDAIVNAIRNGLCQPFGKAIPLTLRLKRELSALRKRLGSSAISIEDAHHMNIEDNEGSDQTPGRKCTRV